MLPSGRLNYDLFFADRLESNQRHMDYKSKDSVITAADVFTGVTFDCERGVAIVYSLIRFSYRLLRSIRSLRHPVLFEIRQQSIGLELHLRDWTQTNILQENPDVLIVRSTSLFYGTCL